MADGTIYFGCGDGKLYAIVDNGTSAVLKWTYTTGGQILRSSPTVGADRTIYIGSYDDKVYAINPDGTLKWTYTTGGTIACTAAIGADGTIYIGSYDSTLYALIDNGNNATLKWSYTGIAGYATSSVSIGADGTIYAVINGLYALIDNGNNATLKWSYTPGAIQGIAISKNGTIYFGYGTTFCAITDNGINNYTATKFGGSGAITLISPTIGADGTIYVGRYNGILQAYNSDGTQKWAITISGGKMSSTAAIGSDGTLYIGIDYFTTRGGLYAFKDLPVANFTVSNINGTTSNAIQFTDNSTRYPSSWLWDFGDGTNSTEENPTHTYTKSGTYTVTLTVTNSAGSSTETMTDYITITDTTAPVPSADLPSGSYNTTQTVNLNATDNEDSNPQIYYTTDGTDPQTSSTRTSYTGSITITNTTTLKYAAIDAAGNWATTQTQIYTIDTVIPTVKVVDPINSASNVAVNKVITVTFSEPIKVCTGWIELKNNNGTTIPITWSINGNVLTINANSTLNHGVKYTLLIHTGSVTDLQVTT